MIVDIRQINRFAPFIIACSALAIMCGCVQQKFITVRTYQGPEKSLSELAVIQGQFVELLELDGHEPDRYLIDDQLTRVEYHLVPGKHELIVRHFGQVSGDDSTYMGSPLILKVRLKQGQVYRLYSVLKDVSPYSSWYQESIDAAEADGDIVSAQGILDRFAFPTPSKFPYYGTWTDASGQTHQVEYGSYQPGESGYVVSAGIYRVVLEHIGSCVFVAVSELMLPQKAKHWQNFWAENSETLSQMEYVILEGLLGTYACKYTKLNEFSGFDSNYRDGWETLNQGDLERAISIFTRGIDLSKGNIAEYIEWSDAFEHSNSPEHAAGRAKVKDQASKFANHVPPSPKLAELYLNRGVAYQRNGNIDKAIEDFSRAIKVHNHYALAYFNRGLCYSKINNKIKAIGDMNKAKQLAANTNLKNLVKMHRLDK